jgi:hypothetical protein
MYLRLYTKINSKQMIELNVKCRTVRLLKEGIGKNPCGFFCLLVLAISFNCITKSIFHKRKNDKLAFIKIKIFLGKKMMLNE